MVLRVSDYVANAIAKSGKTHRQIAAETGFKQPNMISMIKLGCVKLPINKIPRLSRALGIEPYALLSLAMAEYQPENWLTIERVLKSHLGNCTPLRVSQQQELEGIDITRHGEALQI